MNDQGSYPLDVSTPFRVLAWPRYDDADLTALFGTFGRSLTRQGLCLLLRFDRALDGDLEQALPVLEKAAEKVLGKDANLNVLVVDDPLSAGDVPRIGKDLDCALRLPSSDRPERAAFLAALGTPLLGTHEEVERRLLRAASTVPAIVTSQPTSVLALLHGLAQHEELDARLPADEPRERNDIRGAVAYLLETLEKMPDPSERLQRLDELARRRPFERALLVAAARILLEQGRKAEAAAKAREALSIRYDDVQTQRLFLEAAGEKNWVDQASDRFCEMPFQEFQIYDDGSVYLCNCTQVPYPIGNVHRQSWQEIWSSPFARKIRQSILDGTFKYCSPMNCCRRLSLPKRSERPEAFAKLQAIGADGRGGRPQRLGLYYDRSCNLSCPSCRTKHVMASPEQRQVFDKIRDDVVLPLLEEASYVYITGSGDPFAGPHYRDLLTRLCDPKYAKLELDLMTNGIRLTEDFWNQLAPLHARVQTLTVSIDSLTPEVYARLRRGATFDQVRRTMEFLARERRAGKLRRLVINFVVQQENFLEMRPMIEQAKAWAVDGVNFFHLRTWGSYDPAEYRERDICNPLHRRHPELLEELEHPLFRERIVNFWDLKELIDRATSNARAKGKP